MTIKIIKLTQNRVRRWILCCSSYIFLLSQQEVPAKAIILFSLCRRTRILYLKISHASLTKELRDNLETTDH
jgi:hypothetical protein